MADKFDKVLTSQTSLWVVTGLASLLLLGLLSNGDGDAAAFMVMSGLLVSFFTRNMVIVLGAAGLMSMLYVGSNVSASNKTKTVYREGFKSDKRAGRRRPARQKPGMPDSKVAGPLQGGESVQATIANLEEILGSGSVDTMSDTTKRLLEQQNMLGKKLENLLPLVQQGMGMLDKVGGTKGINQMIEVLENFNSKGGAIK